MHVMRVVRRVVVGMVVVLVSLAAVAVIAVGLVLHASLAQLDGQEGVPGLSEVVFVERDALGVPTLRGNSRTDVAAALGFVHAQERFFQMDLQRRRASGELAELFGPPAASWDVRVRSHRFGEVAREVVESLGAEDRELLDAYSAGVNAGLGSLQERPFEYILLGESPRPWRAEDSVLTVLSMFLQLNQSGGEREMALQALSEILPPQLFDLLACPGSEWDAPMTGAPFDVPEIPGPEVINLHSLGDVPEQSAVEDPDLPGSNAWAVAARRTREGGAILACDMHLGLMVPNIWFRARLQWLEAGWSGEELEITGVTLPGTPFVVAGSNGHVAWGYTNSYGDWTDVVPVTPVGSSGYMGPAGPLEYERWTERVVVADADDIEVELRSTFWGPVIAQTADGRTLALRWTAHYAKAVGGGFRGFETARDVDEMLAIAPTVGIPPQNLVVADLEGRVGWTIAGRIPMRIGDSPESGLTTNEWQGWLDPQDYPVVVDPEEAMVWTANARVVGGEAYRLIGDGGYPLGARAQQIRDALSGLDDIVEQDMLDLQLDDRALFLEWWHELLVSALEGAADDETPGREQLLQVVKGWSGHAAVDDPGYRFVRAFRLYVRGLVLDPLVAGCAEIDGPCGWEHLGQREAAVRKMLTERPDHLLDPRHESWDDLVLAAADRIISEYTGSGGKLEDHPWGERNTVRIRHPLSRAVPEFLAGHLDMPAAALPGDSHMPRVQSVSFGASERFVVSPGREENGIFHMPGGQSGHPLSPFFDAGHDAWMEGTPSPFLPGPTVHFLTLRPEGSS